MKNRTGPENQTRQGILRAACAAALAVACTVSPPAAHADGVTPPPVPSNIQVAAGNKAFLEGHAVGTQDYICLATGWTFFGPQATLFNDHDNQIITHFLSPNPAEDGTLRATWQDSRDTSAVWAMMIAFLHPRVRHAGCHSLAAAAGDGSPGGTDRWRQADGDHVHPAPEHHGRGRTVDRLYLVNRRRQEGVGALHGRLCLLQGRPAPRGPRQLGPRARAMENRTARSGRALDHLVVKS